MEPEQRPHGPARRVHEGDALRCVRHDWNGCVIIQVSGEVDWATAPVLREALATASESPTVIVDLTGVSFLDSSGLSILIRADRHTKAQGARFRLAGPRPTIRKILRMTDADRVIAMYETLNDALDDIGAPPSALASTPVSLGGAYGLTDWLWPGTSGTDPIGLN